MFADEALRTASIILLAGLVLLIIQFGPGHLFGGTVPCPQGGGGHVGVAPSLIIPTVSACPAAASGPLAAFTYDSCVFHGCTVVGFPINFNASWSASTNGPITQYTWNFGDGSPQAQTTTPTISHNLLSGCSATNNSCNITLTVKDIIGMTDTIVQVLSTLTAVPRFTFQPISPRVGQSVGFESSTGQGYCSTANNYNFRWSLDDNASASGPDVSHVYFRAGIYRVVLTCYNSLAMSQVSETVHVTTASGPLAAFSYDSCFCLLVPGFQMNFNASWSASPNGTIVLYSWNFGDNRTAQTTSPFIGHVYMSLGPNNAGWQATLTVEDSSRLNDTITQTVTPDAIPRFTFQPSSPMTGQPVSFDASASRVYGNTNTTVAYGWSFGDGAVSSGPAVTHQYSNMGIYRVTLTFFNVYGPSQISRTVSVAADPPAAPGGGGGRPPSRV